MNNTISRRVPKALAVSFWYPPKVEPRAIQVSRLLKHLNVSAILVCASDDDNNGGEDAVGLGDSESFLDRTIRVPAKSSGWRTFIDRVAGRVHAPVWGRTPDTLGSWKRPTLAAVNKVIGAAYRPDVMITFSYPLVDSLIGLELKRQHGFPWLAHFSDPWIDNPFRNDDPLTRAMNSALEKKVITNADRIVFTSEETADLVTKKYDQSIRAKTRVVPHGYEPSLFQHSLSAKRDSILIRYVGDLYLNRTPRPLFAALRELMNTDADLLRNVCFEIVGGIHRLDLNTMGLSALPPELISLRGRVGYFESLRLMSEADGLMVIDAPAEKSVFLPSKLIEYVGSGRPIIGLTPSGAAANLIRRLGGWVAAPDDVSDITRAMREFLSHLNEAVEDPAVPWGNTDVRRQYEAGEVASKFESVISEMVNSLAQ